MKYRFVLIFLTFVSISHAQITKDNWLMGGTFTFTHITHTSESNTSKSTQINTNPRIGYFITDHFALGVIGKYGWMRQKPNTNIPNNSSSASNVGIGSFFRYYFLPIENRINILIEANGTYNSLKSSQIQERSNFLTYGMLAGPVFFLNSSVGLEILVGYNEMKSYDFSLKHNAIDLNIGIQYHLERNK